MRRALHRIEGREGALGPKHRRGADVVARASSPRVLFGLAVSREWPPSPQQVRREGRAALVGPRGRDGRNLTRGVPSEDARARLGTNRPPRAARAGPIGSRVQPAVTPGPEASGEEAEHAEHAHGTREAGFLKGLLLLTLCQ